MTEGRRTESVKPTARERRQARLAAALRANLKRRKAAASGEPSASPDPPKAARMRLPPDRC